MTYHPLKEWMDQATPAQQQDLADEVCSGSRPYLYHWSNGHREPSAATAIKIEHFTRALSVQTGGTTPIVHRTDLSTACAGCEFAAACMKVKGAKS